MQDERKEQIEDSEEVEAHRKMGAGAAEEPGIRRRTEEEDDDEVEAHAKMGPQAKMGPEEFGQKM